MGRLTYYMKYGVWASRQDWDARQRVVENLEWIGFEVEQCPNPCRLEATKGNRLFIIDIIDGGVIIDPIKFVSRDEVGDRPVFVTNIPNDDECYGIADDESEEYLDAVEAVSGDVSPFSRPDGTQWPSLEE